MRFMEHQYINNSILEFLKREKMARQHEKEEAELARQLASQEHIYSYPDGSVYMGQMQKNDPENIKNGGSSHLRHGRGTLRTAAFVYGISAEKYTSDEAVENARFAKWFEYTGTWKDDKMNGYGVHVQKTGSGNETLIFEGIWTNGVPTKSIHAKDADGDYNQIDDTVFGW